MPTVAIIVPCYNQGRFLGDALDSVRAQTFGDFEIVVVDDGSTEPATIEAIDRLSDPRLRVVRTANRGLAAARNAGIAAASARFILPLDADDRIAPTFLEKAVPLLEADPKLGIVSCEAEFFGTQQGRWALRPFRFPEFLLRSSLFATALFRRADWNQVGGYSEEMIYGYEDYDFWLSLIAAGREVHRIPEVLFFYRRASDGMAARIGLEQKLYSYRKLYEHHRSLYHDNIEFLFRTFLEQEAALSVRDARTLAQVFAPTPAGFSEASSARTEYHAGEWQILKLEITTTQPVPTGEWRLDPGVGSGVYEISLVRILSDAGALLFEIGGGHLASSSRAAGTAIQLPGDGNACVFSFGPDPQLLFGPVGIPAGTRALRVEITLRALDDLAVSGPQFRALAERAGLR